jgi:hypothetical protein
MLRVANLSRSATTQMSCTQLPGSLAHRLQREAGTTAPQQPPLSPHLARSQQHGEAPFPLARTMHRGAAAPPSGGD